jgi:predicted methyltransferase
VSNTEKVFGAVKAIMLMQERFDGIDKKILRLEDDLTDVGKSHSELAQRVAAIEGYIRGRADQAAIQPRLTEDKQ